MSLHLWSRLLSKAGLVNELPNANFGFPESTLRGGPLDRVAVLPKV